MERQDGVHSCAHPTLLGCEHGLERTGIHARRITPLIDRKNANPSHAVSRNSYDLLYPYNSGAPPAGTKSVGSAITSGTPLAARRS